MTEKEYRASPGVNKSTLWEIRKSPAHYKYLLDNPPADTQAMRFGRAVHAAVLRPNDFLVEYAVLPSIDRRTNAGKQEYAAFVEDAAGKEVITAEEAAKIHSIATAVLQCPEAAALLEGCEVEKSIFWTDPQTGIDCKGRLDAYKTGIVVDLKTCVDASEREFTKSALKLGYDVQAAHYLRGVRALEGNSFVEWFFIAVEKEPPYAVNVLRADDAFIDRGTWQLMELLEKLRKCQEKDSWPGYGKNDIILPAWALLPDEE